MTVQVEEIDRLISNKVTENSTTTISTALQNDATTTTTSTSSNATLSTTTHASVSLPPTLTLDRKSDLRKSLVFIVAYLLLEIGKQLSNFGLSRTNSEQYPVPSSLLVFLTELTKLTLVLSWAAVTREPVRRWQPSLRFSGPAVCYLLTNLLYLAALTYVTPPLWMILIQTRTLYTAIIYLVVFGRRVTCVQVVGCMLVVGSIPLAKISEVQAGHTSLTSPVILLSQVCAFLSTIASVAVEILLKNDERSFCEQQVWLYVWGCLLGAVALPVQVDLTSLTPLLQSVLESRFLAHQIILAVTSSALAGLCVPFIVRNLDSIAKDYLAALNNLLLSVVMALVFPVHFTLSWLYLLSLAFLLLGIWLYERKVTSCHL
ncbi:CMP-sialic acid transporter 1-like [Homarus americanus]|uniref:CMP-sialic acid transporter 4-like 2 n=1 Tax=Homarus americanus TaxID=6706 RepID=A0A8J5K2T5_HOMAM|nr:CMP-sialic acid transporter 1-like [Homarus americanus]KAG7169442.1 CMP-sialic acid transporter 4-like 2 [Homarus americanus]